jgi:Family of unknown function (DUF7002)
MRIEDLAARYPLLYHMAERDSWPGIQRHGLLSTTAALDLFGVSRPRRYTLESCRRPEKDVIEHPLHGRLILRDQKPLNEKRLKSCLEDNLTPQEWYEILNGKTFFWTQRERLTSLLNAHAYRNDEHDVLTVDSRRLLAEHRDRVFLCHMNSGNAGQFAHSRGLRTFQRISEYPARRNGSPLKPVVELVVEYSVPDVAQHVVRVERMRSAEVLELIWEQ